MSGLPQSFGAPWGKTLRLLSSISCAILVGVAIIILVLTPDLGWLRIPLALLPFVVLISAVFYIVREYELTSSRLIVHRLCWTTEFDLSELRAATVDPTAMSGSLRVFGNGGLFSFTGRYWSRRLGHYRALANDPKLSVILEFPEQKLIITPDDPERFAATVGPLIRVSEAA